MKKLVANILAILASTVLLAEPTYAQNTRTFVSSAGGGSTCTRTAPCNSLSFAYSVTNDGGEITILDAGDFGSLAISSKSLTINGTEGAVLTGNQTLIMTSSSISPIQVTLRNLTFDGRGTGGTYGIRWAAVSAGISGTLTIQNCIIRNYNSLGAAGIEIEPTGTSKIVIVDTIVNNSGGGVPRATE
jgi:hypothetical protein